MMTCLTGYFIDPSFDSLAESLLKAPGGAAAVFSSTGITVPGPQDSANAALYRAHLAELFGARGSAALALSGVLRRSVQPSLKLPW